MKEEKVIFFYFFYKKNAKVQKTFTIFALKICLN